MSGRSGDPAETGAKSDTDDTAGFGRLGFQSVPASCENETTRGSFGLTFSPLLKSSTICLMGVMPAIGSFENGKLKAIAPTIFPSMYTGEPDMPANTPVFSTFPPVSLAMIADWRGPGNPGSTPRTSTPNSSLSEPLKTVLAIPFIPGRTSLSGKSAGVFGGVVTPV